MHEQTERDERISNSPGFGPEINLRRQSVTPFNLPPHRDRAPLPDPLKYNFWNACQWGIASLIWVIFFTALWGATAWSAHVPQLQWMAPYHAADGSSCCGISDCMKAEITLLSEPTEEMVRVLVSMVEDDRQQYFSVQTVVVVPGRSIHRSEDAHSWYCTRSHFQSWTNRGETTSQPCVTDAGYRIISPCVRCIFVNFGA